MKKITIQLQTIESANGSGWSFSDDNTVQIELDQETYETYENNAKRLGINILDALGHGITTMIKHGFST